MHTTTTDTQTAALYKPPILYYKCNDIKQHTWDDNRIQMRKKTFMIKSAGRIQEVQAYHIPNKYSLAAT